MNCIICGNKTRMDNVYSSNDGTYRKFKCTKCGSVFFSEEVIVKDYDRNLRSTLSAFYRVENRKKKNTKNEMSDLQRKDSSETTYTRSN